MAEKSLFIKFLSQFDLSVSKVDAILALFGNMDVCLDNFVKIKGLDKILSYEECEQMFTLATKSAALTYIGRLLQCGIKLFSRFDSAYPDRLRDLPGAPYWIFCKGDVSLLNSKSIAMVGTRAPTNYGRMMTDKFAGELARSGVTIISGLAYGIDSIAHRKALDVGGKTIAVLGSGFNNIYPVEHKALAEEIAQKGLLITEYPPSVKATKYTFPTRNRIIAGLADGVFILEAKKRSGTLYTKEYAIEFGKDLYALPGAVNSPESQLPNMLIKSGAYCVTEVEDILLNLGMNKVEEKKKVITLTDEEEIIVNLLSSGEKDINYMAENSSLGIEKLNSLLLMLELRDIVRSLPGGVYALVK